MEGQQSQERQYNPGMRRVGIIIGIIMLLSAAETIWKHGLKNWDWVQSAAFAGMGFVMATEAWPAEPQKASWWPQRILYLLWMALFIAWFSHEEGWVPGLCFAAFVLLGVTHQQSGLWSMSLRKPLGTLSVLLAVIYLGWYARQMGEWVPIPCAAGVVYLLAHERQGRRSLRDNLWRLESTAWIAIFLASLVWLVIRFSLGHFTLSIAILVLWFGNLLLHLSSGEQRLALSHPQS